ncbi:uncharacterized protein LOC135401028 isoform X2 [Ornithodoros turicata]|uniref:uncharacterized protein LOC135401028 isoform X2 n=1 Tax=Ornithodoros turicata TaxID=34597 RepID=UPI0031394703
MAGCYRLTKDEGSALVKEEQLRRRNLRLEEVRLQSRCLAACVRQRVEKKKEDEINLLKRNVSPGIHVSVEMEQGDLGWQCKSQTQDLSIASTCDTLKLNHTADTESSTVPQECPVEAGHISMSGELLNAAPQVALKQVEKTRSAEQHDLLYTDTIDNPLASPAAVPSRKPGPRLIQKVDANFDTPRSTPMAKALAEMSRKQKEIFGDTLSPVRTPKAPVMSPLSRAPLVPHHGSPIKKLEDRGADAAVREQRRKNALKLLEDLEQIDRESFRRYLECKENVKVNIPALCHSLKRSPMARAQNTPHRREQHSPGCYGSPGRPTSFGHSAALDTEHDEQTVTTEESGSFDLSRFQNITLRRPCHSRTPCDMLSLEVDDSPGAATDIHDSDASPCSTSSGKSSSATSATSYLSLPEGFGFARAEAHIQRCRQEYAAQLKQLTPAMYYRMVTKKEGDVLSVGRTDLLEDTPAHESPVHSPGSLDTAFIETSSCSGVSPVSQLSSPHGLSPTYQTSPAWRCEPDGSSPSPVNTPGDISQGKEETDSLQYIDANSEGDSSPGANFCAQSPRPRPPFLVRMLANQEVLIPHQLSTIAEIDTSASSKGSSGSSGRLSEEGGSHERSTLTNSTTPKGFQTIFMGLEQNIDAVEAELRAMRNFSLSRNALPTMPSLTEETLLMNVAQPTLLAADASCRMLEQSHVFCPSTTSPMSDSLISFMRHEESIAQAEEIERFLQPGSEG